MSSKDRKMWMDRGKKRNVICAYDHAFPLHLCIQLIVLLLIDPCNRSWLLLLLLLFLLLSTGCSSLAIAMTIMTAIPTCSWWLLYLFLYDLLITSCHCVHSVFVFYKHWTQMQFFFPSLYVHMCICLGMCMYTCALSIYACIHAVRYWADGDTGCMTNLLKR